MRNKSLELTESEYTPPASHEPVYEEFGIQDIVGMIIDGRWLIVGITLLFLGLGAVRAITATPIYRADALLQVEERRSQMFDLGLSNPFGRDTSVNAEIEIIRSRSVLGSVVDDLMLDVVVTPHYMPVIGEALARLRGKTPTLNIDEFRFSDENSGERFAVTILKDRKFELSDATDSWEQTGTIGTPSTIELGPGQSLELAISDANAETGQVFTIDRQSKLAAIQRLRRGLSITDEGYGSGIITIALDGTDPNQVYRQVNAIAESYVQKNVARKSAEAQSTLEFLEQQLPTVKASLEAAETALNQFRLEKGSVDLSLETQGVLENIVVIEGQLGALRRERVSALQAFTPAHPSIIALDNQISRLTERRNELTARVRELPNTQQEILRLMRDVEVNTELYTSLLNTAQELNVVKAGTVGNVRIIDYAVPRFDPIRPDRMEIFLWSLLIGLVAGLIAALMRKIFQAGVEDPDSIERHVQIPVYATIPHSRRQARISKRLQANSEGDVLLINDSPDDMAIESLRNLQTAMHFGTMDAQNNCIMIAGPSPDVGKSFVSANLAAILTGNDGNVLLIDGDMRRGHLNQYLGMSADRGLSDFIAGRVPIRDAIHETGVSRLFLVPCGSTPPNPTELLLHSRFKEFLDTLIPKFDHIIIDSPPILAAADASIIGQVTGATLMVLRSGGHPMREIVHGARQLQRAGVNIRGLIINDVKSTSKLYGAGRFAYQYKYQ